VIGLLQNKPLDGKDVFYLFQNVDAPLGADADAAGFQTDGSWNRENSINDEITKNGRIVGYGQKSETAELTMYAAVDDKGQNALEKAFDNQEYIKVWRVVLQKNANGKYPSRFGYAIIENLEPSDGAEGFVEYSVSLPIMGISKTGELELTDEFVQSLRDLAAYEFEAPGETGVDPATTP
jgi:TP901-1 family phage major tail protein